MIARKQFQQLLRTALAGGVLAACTVVSAGCGPSNGGGSGDRSVGAGVRESTPVHTRLARGSRTINYLVNQGGTISVYDVTADRTLYRSQVPPQTRITIDPQTGITVGGGVAFKGPLTAGNTRELRLER